MCVELLVILRLFKNYLLHYFSTFKQAPRHTADVVKTSRSPIVWHVLQKQNFNVLIVSCRSNLHHSFTPIYLKTKWFKNKSILCRWNWLEFWIFKKPQNHQRCRARAEISIEFLKRNIFEWDSRLIWKKVEIRGGRKNTCIIFAVKLETGEREAKHKIGLLQFFWLLKIYLAFI